jgi:hypothetical protein
MRRLDSILILFAAGSFAAAAQVPAKPAPQSAAKASAPAAGSSAVTQRQGDNVRTGVARSAEGKETASTGTPREPNIGFIESPSATCYQPDPAQDICYINWYNLSVNASPNYMIAMSARLNAKGIVSSTLGFFQTSMYVPYNMLGNGFKVQCGPPQNEDPAHPCSGQTPPCVDPTAMGNAYAYTIRARDSAGLSSANYGTVSCPAFNP